MATSFQSLYDSFLSKITDIDLINLPADDIEITLHKYMISSCAKFTKCQKNLSNRDETLSQFNQDLSDFEIEVIANMMVYEWINPFVNNVLLMRQFLSESDFKTYSQSAHLGQLQSLKSSIQDEVDRLIIQYTYDNFNFNS